MNIETIRSLLLWCVVINAGILLWWALLFLFAHDWLYRVHSRWIHVSVERFDSIHYAAIVLYKSAVILFFLVPYIAIRIVM